MNAQTIREKFSARLHEVLNDAPDIPVGDGRQTALARVFKVSQTATRKWLEGESIPETTRVVEICLKYGVSVDWLLTGRGDKFTTGLKQVKEMSRFASPRTQRLIMQLSEAERSGRVTDKDIEMMESVLVRLLARASGHKDT